MTGCISGKFNQAPTLLVIFLKKMKGTKQGTLTIGEGSVPLTLYYFRSVPFSIENLIIFYKNTLP
jgi:hypothetical protein